MILQLVVAMIASAVLVALTAGVAMHAFTKHGLAAIFEGGVEPIAFAIAQVLGLSLMIFVQPNKFEPSYLILMTKCVLWVIVGVTFFGMLKNSLKARISHLVILGYCNLVIVIFPSKGEGLSTLMLFLTGEIVIFSFLSYFGGTIRLKQNQKSLDLIRAEIERRSKTKG